MYRRLVTLLAATAILAGLFVARVRVYEAEAWTGTVYIRASGDFEPVDAPMQRSGDVYTLTDDITGSGEGIVVERDNIIIDGNGHALRSINRSLDRSGISVFNRNNVTIKGVTITGFSEGIKFYSSSRNNIDRNNLTNNVLGLRLEYFNHSSISGNNMKNNSNGIWADFFSNNSISGNTIADNAYGVELGSSSGNSIDGNNITNNDNFGIELESCFGEFDPSNHNSVSGNNVEGNEAGIVLRDSSYNSISGNNITNNGNGVILSDYLYSSSGSNNNSIKGNNMADNYRGVWLKYSSDNSISGNNIATSNEYGIWLEWSPGNSIDGNNVATTSKESGICLYESSNNSISRNCISGSANGIELEYSNYSRVSGNNITDNAGNGIDLRRSSNNSISGNHIAASGGHGLYLHSSSDNSIYHNNLDNTDQIYDVSWSLPQYSASINVWDVGYPSGGNYWSNYNGTDSDNDGIGDSGYAIYADNTDRYPLMGVFSEFNATSARQVQTICNSTITNFHFSGTAICFDVSGESGTAGFCRICIPRALMNSPYGVFVNGTEVQHIELICSNSTHAYLCFSYTLSTKEVIIVPEFPSFLILPLSMIATIFAVIVYKKKRFGISEEVTLQIRLLREIYPFCVRVNYRH